MTLSLIGLNLSDSTAFRTIFQAVSAADVEAAVAQTAGAARGKAAQMKESLRLQSAASSVRRSGKLTMLRKAAALVWVPS